MPTPVLFLKSMIWYFQLTHHGNFKDYKTTVNSEFQLDSTILIRKTTERKIQLHEREIVQENHLCLKKFINQ